jgi:catechol 2,3-dioxygenase-like lactoylglutathione lyase family enzyme
MTGPITLGGIHHITLTVSDVAASADFYSRHFGFNTLIDLGARKIMGNGALILAVTLPSDVNAPAPADDRFSENRIGLDHVSFSIGSHAELQAAAAYLDEQGVTRGEIRDLGPGLGIYVMAVRDPDNIQLELTAPYARD